VLGVEAVFQCILVSFGSSHENLNF
jgi:hypothetical protein